jgi:hypothetical protein
MNTARAVVRVWLAVCTLGFALPALAADDNWYYPAPARTFEIEGGYRVPVREGEDSESYYRISYLGELIDSAGTPQSVAQHFEITEAKPQHSGGDRSALELSLESGATTLGGTLFELNGAMPLEFRGLGSLRGAAYVTSDSELDNLKAAVGLETRPIRIPGMSKHGITNWLVLGVMGERSEATDDGTQDSTYGLVTARLFLGKAFGWRKSAQPELVAQAIAASILEAAPDLEAGKRLVDELSARPANTLTKPQATLIDAVGDFPGGPDWANYIRRTARGIADAITDQQTVSVYLEASGWNAFSVREGLPRRRGLVTLTADYWPLTIRDDLILRARYEWGYHRAAPDIKVNQFLVTLNVQL